MTIDIHCHVVGKGTDITNTDSDIYFYPDDNQLLFTRLLASLVEDDLIRMEADLNKDGAISTGEYFNCLYRMFTGSRHVDGMVLLAMDAVYAPETGALDVEKTDLWVSNAFLLNRIRVMNHCLQNDTDPRIRAKKFYLGASVSPNRKDWEAELDFVLAQPETVLLKWIPSTQHIRVKDGRHAAFYDAMAKAKLPLLCHSGPEYSFPEGLRKKQLDHFRFLEKPLEHNVTVIAAHCATPVFPLIDKNEIRKFVSFMKSANGGGTRRLWGDTSALSLSTRLPFIPEILDSFPPDWLVHGSDFPIPIDSWPHLPFFTRNVSPNEYVSMCKTVNPLDRDVMIKRAHGFSDTILGNAEQVLRLS